MDGKRRVAEPVKKVRKDCALRYRIAVRSFAVLFLAAAILRGAVTGGHLDYEGSPWHKAPGKFAELFGLAAIDIEMAGLQHHGPKEVLNQIGVKPGGPMIGFDAKKAREKLQELDWVESATVIRRFPNQLHVTVVERKPFVVWQHNGSINVVDQGGKVMSGISPKSSNVLMHVVGEGANLAASQLVNQMEATPGLLQDVKAAVRVGDRRWNLHMANGIVIALPEHGLENGLKAVESAYLQSVSSGLAVQRMDFRIAGHTVFEAKSPATDPTTTSSIQ
jgi:cell division protein FtsQ